MLCVASSTKLLDCCWCVHYTYCNLKWWPFCIVNKSSVSKKPLDFTFFLVKSSLFWGRYHDLIVNMLVSRLRCFFFGGKVWCEHGQPGPEKIHPRGSRWSGIQGELCKWEFRSIFFGRRTWHGFLCYFIKKNDWHGNLKRTIQNFQKWDVLWCAHRPNVT